MYLTPKYINFDLKQAHMISGYLIQADKQTSLGFLK